jgi:NAD(P)-dependent dehydrogenase (short-subunit alcohol dehydrogenase family)
LEEFNMTNLFDLSGKVAVITGASAKGGIGHATALCFAQAGADLFVSDIDDDGVRATGDEIRALGRKAGVAHCDISNPADVENLFKEVDQQFGRVDILVNVPFIFPSRVHPHELTLEAWNKTLAVCLTGYMLCSQQAIRRMLAKNSGGAIINVGSIAGASGMGRGNFPYSCAKAAVHELTKELAVEYARNNIRVNAIMPAQVLTPGLSQLLEDPRFRATIRARTESGIPMGRLLNPDEMAGPILFLASEAASAITGALLPVDGGNLAMNAGGSHTWPED